MFVDRPKSVIQIVDESFSTDRRLNSRSAETSLRCSVVMIKDTEDQEETTGVES